MLRKMFGKKVTIAGKSVSLALIALLVIATTAFAAWLLLSQMTATFSTVSIGPVFADGDPTGIVNQDVGIPGVTCTTSGSVFNPDWSVSMANADVGDKCEFGITMKNDGDYDLYVGPLSNDPSFAGAFIVSETNACGQLIPANSIKALTWYFELSPDSDPATTYGPSVMDIEYSVAAPVCP